MTAALRLRVLPRFPARIEGADGVKVTRATGSPDLTVSLDFANLGDIAGIPDPAKNYFAMWNEETGSYVRIPFQAMFDSSGVSTGYPTIAAAELANIPVVVRAIEVYGDTAVGDGLGGLYIDIDNGSFDTFVSAGGTSRTWYRAADINTSRVVDGAITEPKLGAAVAAKLNGAMQKADYDPQEVGGDAFDRENWGEFETQSAAQGSTIRAGVSMLLVLSGDKAGVWTATDNGSAETFTSNEGARTWYRAADVNRERLTSAFNAAIPLAAAEYGAAGDGAADDYAELLAADTAAFSSGKPLVLKSGATYRLASSIEFKSEVRARGVTFKADDLAGDASPTVTVYFSRQCELTAGTTFEFVNVAVAPQAGDADFRLHGIVRGCRFIKSKLTVGHSSVLSFGHQITGNEFVNTYSRNLDAITLVNAPQSVVCDNRIQEYWKGIVLTATRSFSGSGIEVEGNVISNAAVGIEALGTSMRRFTGLSIKKNVIGGTRRDSGALGRGGILVAFGVDVEIAGNEVTHGSSCIHVQGSLGVNIEKNTANGWTDQPPIRTSGCQDVRIQRNAVHQTEVDGYGIICVPFANNILVVGNYYQNRNIVIRDNDLACYTRCIGVQSCEKAVVCENRIRSRVAPNATGFLNFNAVTNGYHYDNQYYAPSGTPVVVVGGSVTSTRPATTVIATTTSAASVTAPVITASDASLNNAKSYVTQFTVGAIEQIHQLADDDSFKTLSQWMGTVTGETLGWNSSAWTSEGNNVSDILVDGAIYDNYGVEYHPAARYSLLVIDRAGRLSCRDFRYPTSFLIDYPMHIGAQAAAERAWITASFRPPLVVDNTVYDAVAAGLMTSDQYNVDLSGRQALGQKSDGTFVLVTVDGTTGASGCTVAQIAARMLALGCVNAYNLDGGGSVSLWYGGAIINTPSDPGGERAIPAAMYV